MWPSCIGRLRSESLLKPNEGLSELLGDVGNRVEHVEISPVLGGDALGGRYSGGSCHADKTEDLQRSSHGLFIGPVPDSFSCLVSSLHR